jgi:hypothetical protein
MLYGEEKKEVFIHKLARKDIGEDGAFFLYLAPIVAGIVYGVYEWAAISHTSSTMPGRAYLIVSKSPYLFLFSLVVICLAMIVELNFSQPSERSGIIVANTRRLQILAVVVLIVSFAGALSVAHYSFSDAVSVFIAGRYAIIYAFFLIAISVLLIPREIFGNFKMSVLPEVIGLVLLAASPLIFFAATRYGHFPFVASAGSGLVVAILGLVLLLWSTVPPKKATKPAEAKSQSAPDVKAP